MGVQFNADASRDLHCFHYLHFAAPCWIFSATKGVGHELVVGIPCIRDCFINVLSCRGLLNSLATFLGKIVLKYRRFDGGISQSKHD